jgi:hypothetical protein
MQVIILLAPQARGPRRARFWLGGVEVVAQQSGATQNRTLFQSARNPSLRFIPAPAKNIVLLDAGINALLFRFAWCTA